MGSSSRTHLPQPKVLPFPDLPVRSAKSNEHSRSSSPFATPTPLASPSLATSPPTGSSSAGTSFSPPGVGNYFAHVRSASASPASSSLTLPTDYHGASSSAARMVGAQSPPNPSPLGPSASSSPRPNRPRAATTIATVSARHDGFQPAPRPSTPTMPLVQPINASANPLSSSLPNVVASPAAPAAASAAPAAAPAVASAAAPASTAVPSIRIAALPTAETTRPSPQKSTTPPDPLPASVPVTPTPPSAVVDHLHRSLKTGACADVRIWVRKWGVAWRVHKMVLIQAGFFHSMFMGGFSEMAPVRRSTKSKGAASRTASLIREDSDDDWAGEDLELTFDDPNITRVAFEICLSRLYSPYPQLHFPVSLLPTAAAPLTPGFPSSAGFVPLHKAYSSVADNDHLVTPRLLLSLLATATYLGHQYLLRETLAIVLRTVGPSSVTRYLNFAIGVGIGDEEWEGQDDHGARGMEKVARHISVPDDEWVSEGGDEDHHHQLSVQHHTSHRESTDSTASNTSDDVKCGGDGSRTEDREPSLRFESPSRSHSMGSNATARPDGNHTLASVTEADDTPAFHFYGFVSNKIGEACVCWLTRWGLDLLNVEAAETTEASESQAQQDMPVVWGLGGIPAKFVNAVLSSDNLFVPSEIERYTMARRVLDLRRNAWSAIIEDGEMRDANDDMFVAEPDNIDAWEEDEAELGKVFAEGIYYSHMTFDDLSSISSDVDPTTALPYVPLTVLQAAHWAAADLKTRIVHGKAPPSAAVHELGLAQTTSEIVSALVRRRTPRSRLVNPSSRPSIYGTGEHSTMSFTSLSLSSMGITSPMGDGVYHPVPTDDTHRIGASGLLFFNPKAGDTPVPGIPGMPNMGPEWPADESGGGGSNRSSSKARAPPQGEGTFFGIKRGIRSGPEIDAMAREEGLGSHIALPGLESGKEGRWSKIEPYRFSVEFWNVDKLAEKERLYSATHFYAGSYFNVYVSTIRKKDKPVQLGIYLYRQDPAQAFPPVNSPPSAHDDESPMFQPVPFEPVTRALTLPTPGTGNDLYRAISVTPPVLGSPAPHIVGLPDVEATATGAGVAPSPSPSGSGAGHYLDPRPENKAYFSISCASALGTALVRFSSAPDQFALSQSWGWKSSALRSEEYLSVPVPAGEDEAALGWTGVAGEGGSLRATVVVGII